MDETRIPGELEGVIVRMPIKITHAPIVNFIIAKKINSAALALEKANSSKSNDNEKIKCNNKILGTIATINKYEPISIVDKVMSHLVHIKASKTTIAAFARLLLEKNLSVQCNKVGIAFLGYFGSNRDIDTIKKYAFDEEYTFFVVKALGSLIKNEEEYIDNLIEIASNTYGWGKIAAIVDLPDVIKNPESRYFLLESGTSNTIGKHFLAVECAIKGNLFEFLELAVKNNVPLERDISQGICELFKGLFEAQEIKDADSFDEVPNIESIISLFNKLYEAGFVDSPLAKEIYTNLKSRK